MLIIEFFSWWYTRGFARLASTLQARLKAIWYMFSIPILLKTLFAPWKRIQTDSGKGIQNFFRAIVDNLVSRFVGFTIRLFTIVAGLVSMVAMLVVSLVILIIWPFLPFGLVGFFILGFS